MVFHISYCNRVFTRLCLGVCVFIASCVSNPVSSPQVLPPCVSLTVANPYAAQPQAGALRIYQDFKNSLIGVDEARQRAFSQLGKNTKHWSDHVDIAIDDAQMVRITVTYLDPVLIHYIVLNHVLASMFYMDAVVFENELKATLNRLAERNESLFVITITAPVYRAQAYNSNVLMVRMPVEQMALVNAGDLQVFPIHDDHILNENIDITHGPVSGIVGYPISVLYQDNCTWLMDQWTTTLTLDIPSVTLGATQFVSQFWSIPYRPLLSQDGNQPITMLTDPVPTFDFNYDWSRVSRTPEPPKPNWKPNADIDDTNWKMYWEDMGRYLWHFFIRESHQ